PVRRTLPSLRPRPARRASTRGGLRRRAPPDLRLPAGPRAREVAQPAGPGGEGRREPGGTHRRERPALPAVRPGRSRDAGAFRPVSPRAEAVLRHAPRRGALRGRAAQRLGGTAGLRRVAAALPAAAERAEDEQLVRRALQGELDARAAAGERRAQKAGGHARDAGVLENDLRV